MTFSKPKKSPYPIKGRGNERKNEV